MLKAFLAKNTTAIAAPVHADADRERMMEVPARTEDTTVLPAESPAAILAGFGIRLSKDLHKEQQVLLPLNYATDLTTLEHVHTAAAIEIWTITALGTDSLTGEYMDLRREGRLDDGQLLRAERFVRRFRMRPRVLVPRGALEESIIGWMAARQDTGDPTGKQDPLISILGHKRLGDLGAPGGAHKVAFGAMEEPLQVGGTRMMGQGETSARTLLQQAQALVAAEQSAAKEQERQLREAIAASAAVALAEEQQRLALQPSTMVPYGLLQEIMKGFQTMGPPRGQDTRLSEQDSYAGYTLDGERWPCVIKGQGGTRMLKANGLIRAMGRIRADQVFRDIILNTRGYLDILGMINSRAHGMVDMPMGMDSMDRLEVIWPLPWLQDVTRLESFLLMGEWPVNDFGQWSLRDFQYAMENIGEWGTTPDRVGMMQLWACIQKLEACLEVLLHKAYRGCLASLVIITTWECARSACGFIWYYVEYMMATYWEDLRHRRTPVLLSHISMATPEGCAELLRTMAETLAESMKEKPREGIRALERPPHLQFFHPESGSWRLVRNLKIRTPRGQTTGAASGSIKGLCLYHLAGMCGIKFSNGAEILCKFIGSCNYEHPDQGTMTLLEMGLKVNEDAFRQWPISPAIKERVAKDAGIELWLD